MDKSEHRFLIKFLVIKGFRNKAIHINLETTLVVIVCSLTQVKEWLWRFKTGNFAYRVHSRTGRLSSDLAERLCNLLKEFPFASCKS
jgi:hypothetical protein